MTQTAEYPARLNLEPGQAWLVKRPGENILVKGEVEEVTMRTVLLLFWRFEGKQLTPDGFQDVWHPLTRLYKTTDVEFVEQIK